VRYEDRFYTKNNRTTALFDNAYICYTAFVFIDGLSQIVVSCHTLWDLPGGI